MAIILKLGPGFEKEAIKKTVEALRNSGTAIVPTDTVYGLICDGENEKAKRQIYAIKNRSQAKPLIAFVRDLQQAKKIAFIPDLHLPFILKRWPGRNTFIFRAKTVIDYITIDNTIAIRIPDHSFINELCQHFFYLASTSANISSHPSPSTINEIDNSVVESVSVVIDGGKCQGQVSAIWDMTEEIPILLRGRILFICSGNSCRSPMAEAILRKIAGSSFDIISAGTDMNLSGSISKQALEVLDEEGIKLDQFISRTLTSDLIENSDLIFVMEEKHSQIVLNLCPHCSDKIFVLDVPDPAGKDIFEYRRVRDIIKQRIQDTVIKRIKR